MNKRGFTLMEILIVIALMLMLSTAAMQNVSRSTETFDYFAQLNDLTAVIRQARDFALTGKEFGNACEGAKDAYVVRIKAGEFALSEGGCNDGEQVWDLSGEGYSIEVFNANGQALEVPLELVFSRGGGEVRVFANGVLVPARTSKFIKMRLLKDGDNLGREVVMFQLSGLPEVVRDGQF